MNSKQNNLRPSQKVERYLEDYFHGNSPTNGERLPSSRAIASQIGISEGTVRNVVRRWEREGILVARHGSGTFVRGATGKPENFRVGINKRSDAASLDNQDGWFRNITQAIAEHMMEQGPRISLNSLYSRHEEIDGLPTSLVEARCKELDGMILTFGDIHLPAILSHCQRHRKPYVMLNTRDYSATSNFIATNTFSAYLRAGRALKACGRRRFALFLYPGASKSPSMAHRIAGLSAGIGDELGSEISLRVLNCKGMWKEHALEALHQLLDQERYEPDAMLFSGDPHALAVLDELARRKISVPGDVSIIAGANAIPEIAETGLSSFDHPTHEMGYQLASRLIHMLDNHITEIPGLYLPVGIVPRKTTTMEENQLLSGEPAPAG